MLKKIGVLIGLSLFGVSCTPKATSDGVTTIRFSWWGGDERHTATLAAIRLYEELNPSVKISAEYSGWTGHQEKIATQLAGKTAPDVMQVNHNWLDIFSRSGQGFYDLNSLSADELNLSFYPTQTLNKVTINGYLNMVPYALTGKVFSFNQAALNRYNLNIPHSWDEYRASGRYLAAVNPNSYLIAATDGETAYQIMLYYLLQKTGRTLVNSNRKIAYSEEELIDGFIFLRSLTDSNVLMPQPKIQAAGAIGTVEQLPGWISQDVMGLYAWDSTLAKYTTTLPKTSSLVIAPFPSLNSSHHNNAALAKVSLGFAINKNSKQVATAANFVDFLINDDRAIALLELSRGIPLNSHAVEILRNNNVLDGIVYEANNSVMNSVGDYLDTITEHAKFKSFYNNLIAQFDYHQLNEEGAARYFIEKGNELLTELTR